MSKKWHLWLQLAVVSTLLGTLLAMLQLAFCSYSELSDYELPNLLPRFLIFTAVCFFILGLFVLFFTLLRRFFRWLFSWHIIKRCLIALACLAALIALFYVEEDWRGKRAWEKFKHEWEAKGEKFDFASFIPPPVSDDQNFALTPIVASCYSRVLDKNGHRIQPENTNVINRLKMQIYSNCKEWPTNHLNSIYHSWQSGTKIDLVRWQEYFRSPTKTNKYDRPNAADEFPTSSQPQSPATDVLLALSKYDGVIEELRQASHLPYSRFPLDYDKQLHEMLFPHLEALKSCAQVLQLRAIAELENQQTPKAWDDVKLIVYLANSVHREQIFISQQVRIAILSFTIQPIWEGLAKHKWSDDQLAEINRELAGLDFLSDYNAAVRNERAMALKLIDHERCTHNAELLFGWSDEDSWDFETCMQLFFYHSFPSGWYYQNELVVARMFQQSLQTDNKVEKRRVFPPNVMRQSIYTAEIYQYHRSPYYFYARMLFPALGEPARKFAFMQASVDMARMACALERYRLAHGEYPEKLDALEPQFIDKLPHDIINDQPLHYRRTDNGQFLLYSVGLNKKDDGGVVGLNENGRSVNISTGDWVWQYPQK